MITTRTRTGIGLSVRAGLLARFITRLTTMREVARQRRQLAGLSDQQLKDIGVSRADAEREATQPFWRV